MNGFSSPSAVMPGRSIPHIGAAQRRRAIGRADRLSEPLHRPGYRAATGRSWLAAGVRLRASAFPADKRRFTLPRTNRTGQATPSRRPRRSRLPSMTAALLRATGFAGSHKASYMHSPLTRPSTPRRRGKSVSTRPCTSHCGSAVASRNRCMRRRSPRRPPSRSPSVSYGSRTSWTACRWRSTTTTSGGTLPASGQTSSSRRAVRRPQLR